MSDIYLCSFASPSLDLSVKRFEKEAKDLNIYKNIKIYRKKTYLMKLFIELKTLIILLKK